MLYKFLPPFTAGSGTKPMSMNIATDFPWVKVFFCVILL